jgi:hypothetical protein
MPIRCDMCSAPRPAWRYPARTFTTHLFTPTFDQQSVGDWAACPDCARLIEAGDIAGLTTRSLDALIMDNPELICVLDILKAHQYIAQLWALYSAAGCTLEEAAAAINLWRKP